MPRGERLEPLLGRAAPFFFGLGLFAAGLTSAITAPLAAAYAASGALGWPPDLRSGRFRLLWGFVGRRAASITAKAAGEVGWHSPGARNRARRPPEVALAGVEWRGTLSGSNRDGPTTFLRCRR